MYQYCFSMSDLASNYQRVADLTTASMPREDPPPGMIWAPLVHLEKADDKGTLRYNIEWVAKKV